jgi:predicted GTPase
MFVLYPHIGAVLPAMGYGADQMRELEDTIAHVPCDTVVIATPVDLSRFMAISRPTSRVTYECIERGALTFREALGHLIERAKGR